MNAFKILVTGAVGSGKTTLIREASDGDPVTTEAGSQETPGKTETTVALDYGRLALNDHMLHLYGTPGQARFDYMWDMLGEGMHGMIVLVHAGQDDAASRTEHLLRSIEQAHGETPFLVGVTHTDVASAHPERALRGSYTDAAADVVPVDARNADAVRSALGTLINHLA